MRSGCSKRAIENAESGKPSSMATASDLAAVLGVRPGDLFLNGENKTSDSVTAESSGPFGNAPAMPTLVVGRERDMTHLREQLFIRLAESQVSGEMAMVVVRGWPGVGKTTIARAFAHDSDMRRSFTDGVLWTSLGQSPSVRSVLNSWCQSLSLDPGEDSSDMQISERLAGCLATRRMLLIIDDVWRVDDAGLLLIGGRDCATLITTRLPGVAESFSSKEGDVYNLNVLSEEDALELLKVLAPDVVLKFTLECQKLVRELECLPLALQVAGRLLRIEFRRTGDVRQLLKSLYDDAQKILQAPVPADVHALVGDLAPTVVALFKRSTDMLDETTRDRFAMLAPFVPKPAIFHEDHLATYWEIDNPVPTIRELIDSGLMEPLGDCRYQIHALLIAHARSLLED